VKNDFIYKHFKKWLKTRTHLFSETPHIENVTEDSFEITFKNVDDIKIIFSKKGIEVWAGEQISQKQNLVAKNIDFLTEFSITEKKDKNGYYCDECESRVYFKRRNEVWENHVYVPFIEWVNKNILPINNICFYRLKDRGVFWIKILPTEELEEDKESEFRISARPIIKRE
jgi:hypothetical protein